MNNICKNITLTKKYLNKSNKVIKTNKTNETAIIDSIDYVNKIRELLNDDKKINNNKTVKLPSSIIN